MQTEYQNLMQIVLWEILHQAMLKMLVYSLGWLIFLAKQRVVEYVITRFGGGMMLLKRNVIIGNGGN